VSIRSERRLGTVRLLALLVALSMIAVACGNGDGDAAGDGSADRLVYWSMWNAGEPQADVLEAALQEFEDATGIEVEVQWAGREVLNQVRTRINTEDLPDLTDQEGGELAGGLASIGALQGLGDLYDMQIDGEDVTVAEVIDEIYIDEYRTEDGEPFVLPYELIGSTFWFSGTDHPGLEEDPPATWDEFISLLDDLKADGREPIAIDGDIRFYLSYWATWSIIRHGGVGTLREAALDETGESFDDPAFLAAAEDLHQLITGDYIVSDFTATQWPAQQTAWAAGDSDTDFLLMGSWAPSETAEVAREDFDYRSFPYPQVEGGAGNDAAELGIIGFAIPEGAQNPDAAKQFMAFFMNRDRLEPISSETLNLTPREDVPVPSQLEDLQEQILNADEFFRPYDGADGAAPDWNLNILEEVVAEFFNGQHTPEEFVEQLRTRTADFYAAQ
jgi:ABC-type glycerol-3-phosphate transport system substrate-binding protein